MRTRRRITFTMLATDGSDREMTVSTLDFDAAAPMLREMFAPAVVRATTSEEVQPERTRDR